MGDQIIVLPLHDIALLHLNRHRRKLKIPHGNLSGGRRRDGQNDLGRSVSNYVAARSPGVAREERATDDDRKPTDSEQPKPQCFLTGTRSVFFLLNRSIHVCTSFVALFHLQSALRPAVMRRFAGRFQPTVSRTYLPNEACNFFACSK